ncbi:MAG: family 43 glycosylhydrolase [Lachnospiraceae bacterium]|nr:family 43 glycosylhydrolase [Lachnospiraceae bacterium]
MFMEQVFNPFLPLYEYVADGEPHVFDGRVYIYGSHDAAFGTKYCEGHYVTWSAPADNLRDWRYEGVIYRRNQDPSNQDDKMQLWAPDVTKGPDGRYYLYYCFNFYPEIGVAVSDTPAGPFEFYGHVQYPKEVLEGEGVQGDMMPFDPAVLTDDDNRVYLYYGFAPACEKEMLLPEFSEADLQAMPEDERKKIEGMMNAKMGENGMVVELEQDMLTMKGVPQVCVPGGHHTKGTGFEGHGFFEAPSIRKINGRYYYVYSSHKSHELCYAVSEKPMEGYVYGGVIVSNGDIGYHGRTKPANTLGNNHGGIVKAGEDYYIFYHRQTHGTEFSRQDCAEKIQILSDGSIPQVEITSCGLNGGALPASGSYPAAIACHMTCPETLDHIDYQDSSMQVQTRMVQRQNVQFLTDIHNHTVLGYKYFECIGVCKITLELRGHFNGTVKVAADEDGKEYFVEKTLSVQTKNWRMVELEGSILDGVHSLFLLFEGEGMLDMKSLSFENTL